MQVLVSILVLGDASGLSGAGWRRRRRRSLFKLVKSNVHSTKHLKACINYLDMYGKGACIHKFSNS